MRLAALVAIAACGGTPAVAPAPPPGPAAASAPAPEAAAPAPVTCSDAGVILRGVVDDRHRAGPAKEAAIARSCLLDRWPPDVLACVASNAKPKTCLDALTAEQRETHEARLIAWNDVYSDESLDDPPPEDDVDDAPPPIDCAVGVGDVATYAPPIASTGPERDFAIAMRRRAVLALCERWTQDQRRCFTTGTAAATCRAQLEPAAQQALADALARHEAALAKTAQALKRPGTFECPQVVARHYGDAAWKGHVDHVKPAARRTLIADARALMKKACTAEAWPPVLRACLAGGGGEPCFLGTPQSAQRWGYPPAGVRRTGLPECDEYGVEVGRVARCAQIPSASRDAMADAYNAVAGAWTNIPADQRHAIATSCRQARDAIRQALAALGCAP